MKYKLTLRLMNDDKAFFGPGVMELAEYIESGLSLRQAARRMGMAYSKAWRILNDFEAATGQPLLLSRRGGSGGGGSVLTPEGRWFLERFREFQKRAKEQCDRLFIECLSGGKPQRNSND